MEVGSVRVGTAADCAASLSARCQALAEEHAPAHKLCAAAADLVAAAMRHDAVSHSWSALTRHRIAETWELRPHSLVWLDDKLAQVAHAQALCGTTQPLHLPILASLDADAPEHPVRERTWTLVRSLVEELLNGGEDGTRGLVVKPRHGHDAIGVTVWTAATLGACTLDEAVSRVWQSIERALCCFDESWAHECWQVSAVPRGAVLQPLYDCPLCAGTDCQPLNQTACAVLARDEAVRAQSALLHDREAAEAEAPTEAAVDAEAAPAADVPIASAAVARSPAVPRLVRSNMAAYPLELRVHVLFGSVVGATVRSHANELWVDHTGEVVLYEAEDFRAQALARGAHRCRRFLLRTPRNGAGGGGAGGEAEGMGNEEEVVHPLVHTLGALLRDTWRTLLVPTSERLCAGLDELRVDWLLGDALLGPRIGELTYMGAAFAGVPALSEAMARGWRTCASACAATHAQPAAELVQ